MAYVLGFFTADGNMIKNKRGAHFISIQITDGRLLEKIKKSLRSNHKIYVREGGANRKTNYQLQMGSKEIYSDLLALGIKPNKSKSVALPKIPEVFMPDFVRGYFDGDGSVNVCEYRKKDRKSPSVVLTARFISGSRKFLAALKLSLRKYAGLKGGSLFRHSRSWCLSFSILDSVKLYDYMYAGMEGDMFLERKKSVFERFIKTRAGGTARSVRLPVTEKVAGSNPVRPANKNRKTAVRRFFCFFCFLLREPELHRRLEVMSPAPSGILLPGLLNYCCGSRNCTGAWRL